MSKPYQIATKKHTRKLAEFLSQETELLLPMLDLITESRMAVDELIDTAGRATIEAVLLMSAKQIAGPKHPGKRGSRVRRHGRQAGVVSLAERKLRVERPRLRTKGKGHGGEVSLPAYEAMADGARLGERMLEILMMGVSTRNYRKVLPEMAEAVGMSRSAVSREFAQASEAALKQLVERNFDDLDILIVYLDGQRFAKHHVLTAVGVDTKGYKHVLGMVAGASENSAACKSLLEGLVVRGVKPDRKRLFVIDGSKALRAAVDAVYGEANPVQRCRSHKVRNVADQVPKELKGQVAAAMRAAYRLEPQEGIARLKTQASWLETEYPEAAGSLREGLAETFTVNTIGLPKSLRRCLSTTNIIESPHSGVRQKTRRVTRWKDQSMALRWAASAMLATEKNFRRIMGYEHLWILDAYLKEPEGSHKKVDPTKQAG